MPPWHQRTPRLAPDAIPPLRMPPPPAPAGLQSEATRVAQLRQFIEHALAQDNVWFVTNQQLLAWMKNPVPASRVDTLLKCDKPTDIVFDGPVCETYVG